MNENLIELGTYKPVDIPIYSYEAGYSDTVYLAGRHLREQLLLKFEGAIRKHVPYEMEPVSLLSETETRNPHDAPSKDGITTEWHNDCRGRAQVLLMWTNMYGTEVKEAKADEEDKIVMKPFSAYLVNNKTMLHRMNPEYVKWYNEWLKAGRPDSDLKQRWFVVGRYGSSPLRPTETESREWLI